MPFDRQPTDLSELSVDARSTEQDQSINEAKAAMMKLPEGKRGLVIGSGPMTPEWQRRGWATLDMDPTVDPDFLVNANWMEAFVDPDKFDYVLAERLTFDRKGVRGVRPKRLVDASTTILKDGGVLVVQTIRHEEAPLANHTSEAPLVDDVMKRLKDHGFRVTVESGLRDEHPADVEGPPYSQQELTIYATKPPQPRPS